MNKLHILPTDKPSRVYTVNSINKLDWSEGYLHQVDGATNQNIYITSDEEIKEGDWCLDKFNQRWKLEDKKLIAFDSQGIKRFSTDNILGHECKKIILTTDQDLIKDGIQDIDDEFLEWFVKNPSCEYLEVESGLYFYAEGEDRIYKIIIPKEEQVLIQSSIDGDVIWSDKQETLEEAAERLYPIYDRFKYDEDWVEDVTKRRADFIDGAKWQQERICDSEFLQKLRATKSDAEARRLIKTI